MYSPNKNASPRNILRWFDPRNRGPGTWAFVLHRTTAIGLTLYLYIHLIVLGKLAQGPEAFNSFIATAKNPLMRFGELLVIVAVLIHGLNGLRIIVNSFEIGVPYQKQIFYALMIVALVGSGIFAVRMFTV